MKRRKKSLAERLAISERMRAYWTPERRLAAREVALARVAANAPEMFDKFGARKGVIELEMEGNLEGLAAARKAGIMYDPSSEAQKDLPVPVLAESSAGRESGARHDEARQAPLNVAAGETSTYGNLSSSQPTDARTSEERPQKPKAVSSTGVPEMRERAQGQSCQRPDKSEISSSLETKDGGSQGENPQTGEVREMWSGSNTGRTSPGLQEATGSGMAMQEVPRSDLADSRGGQKELVVMRVLFNPRMVECEVVLQDGKGGMRVEEYAPTFVGDNKNLVFGDRLVCERMKTSAGDWEFVRMADERISVDHRGLPRDRRRPYG